MEKKYKIVLIGDSGIGKSTFNNYLITKTFNPYIESTIGCEFCCYKPSNAYMDTNIKLLIWDVGAQEVFRSFIPQFTRNAALCLLFTDKLDKNFLINYVHEWKKYIINDSQLILVPCRSDLVSYDLKKLYDICPHINDLHVALPISSKTGSGIDDLIYQITKILYDSNPLPSTGVNINNQPVQTSQNMNKCSC